MTAPAIDLHDEVVVGALHELREARRRARIRDWNVIDALYKAYLAAIVGTLVVTALSGVVGDQRVHGSQLDAVRDHGPAAVGLLIAVAVAIGLRSGARGGPLALEAAEVRYVLLAPVDRDVALRQPALRQLRFTVFAGSVGGAAVGLLAYRRLPGSPVPWIACGALTGVVAAATMTGTAMTTSGRRVKRPLASALGAVVLAWSVADLVLERVTSPASYAGQLALWPLRFHATGAAGIVLAAAVAFVGLRAAGGMSLEAAERRGRLVTHLRFAATLQDLRTVMLLRRQLSMDLSRSRPWIRLRPAHRGPTVWRRDWRGILRWPLVRIARLLALGALAGAAMAAAWSGTTAMIVVAGIALYIAGLEAIEGLAQEVDHPDRRESFPIASVQLHLKHLAAPTVVMTVIALAGVSAAAAVAALAAGSDAASLALHVGLPLAFPAGAVAAGAAAVSTLRQPPDAGRLMADSTGMALVFHHALPPALTMAAPGAAMLVRSQLRHTPHGQPAALAASAAINVVFLVVLVFAWVREREAIAGFFAGEGTARVGK